MMPDGSKFAIMPYARVEFVGRDGPDHHQVATGITQDAIQLHGILTDGTLAITAVGSLFFWDLATREPVTSKFPRLAVRPTSHGRRTRHACRR